MSIESWLLDIICEVLRLLDDCNYGSVDKNMLIIILNFLSIEKNFDL